MASIEAEAIWSGAEIAALRHDFVAELDRQLQSIRGHHETAAPWWSEPDGGAFLLHLRFRGIVVPVNGGASTALLHSLEEVQGVLEGVRKAALFGLLDQQLIGCIFAQTG